MAHPVWHEHLQLLSYFASVLGLYILVNSKQDESDDPDNTNHVLFSMTFAYWIVHCMAIAAQKSISPDWEIAALSLKFTAVFSFLLTFSCALSLPLHRISVRAKQTE
ncbi:hypothetical protein C7B65_09660 [Phormidesmis priestleyi ULC007]|uniref:Uncharacterized protein n=1 Tax=Phormidesmis priestleyi ULC007 TaxID=1920490 RepID=A0A2T1DHJ9_9CYAN|nr:hypothetical protein [Phormidesmis priestleyi]PSB19924.1 hypothetical protein C7B65_09660 [Phormidesmis priestleyi ULC007]PZO50378.1 MAG: hypothetical protein DCF14_11950 [Phormidesmis priestleyi]